MTHSRPDPDGQIAQGGGSALTPQDKCNIVYQRQETKRKKNRKQDVITHIKASGGSKAAFRLQAEEAQIRFLLFICDSDLFFHNRVNSTNHMEADLFKSNLGHFHMWP